MSSFPASGIIPARFLPFGAFHAALSSSSFLYLQKHYRIINVIICRFKTLFLCVILGFLYFGFPFLYIFMNLPFTLIESKCLIYCKANHRVRIIKSVYCSFVKGQTSPYNQLHNCSIYCDLSCSNRFLTRKLLRKV